MSKNVILNGEVYNGVSEVELPVSGGTAMFRDMDEPPILPELTNPATAADILLGKEAFGDDGEKIIGTSTASEPIEIDWENDKGVIFVDHEANVLEFWDASEVAEKTALPSLDILKEYEYLTKYGWNWTLEGIQSYMTAHPDALMTVGAEYTVTDGSTKVFITLPDTMLEPSIAFGLNGTAEIDWGDGSQREAVNGADLATSVAHPHEYAEAGNYVVSIYITSGTARILSKLVDYTSTGYAGIANKIYVGASFQFRANFSNYVSLKQIVLSHGITCPDQYSSSRDSLPGVFTGQSLIRSVIIPAVRPIRYVSSIGADSTSLEFLSISEQSMTSAYSDAAWGTIYYHSPVRVAIMPDQAISASDYNANMEEAAIFRCYGLANSGIGRYMWRNCKCLKEITVGSSVLTLKTTFSGCISLQKIIFKPEIPPATDTEVFKNVPTTCVIYVPRGTLEAYTTAAGFPSPDNYTYEEYDVI